MIAPKNVTCVMVQTMCFVTASHDAKDRQTTVRNSEKASSLSGAGSKVICCGIVREKDKGRVFIVSLVPRKNVNLVLPTNLGGQLRKERRCAGGFWVFSDYCQQKDLTDMEKEEC